MQVLGKVVVVLGVMQRQALWFRQCSTLSSFLQLRFLGKDVDVPVVVQRQVPGFCGQSAVQFFGQGCCRARCATTRYGPDSVNTIP